MQLHNYLQFLHLKTMTENVLISSVTESRRLVRADTEDLGILIPESVLSKRKRVIRHGVRHRYRAWPYLRLIE